MKCKNCGNEILEEFEICPYCKAQINENNISNHSNNYNNYTYNRRPNTFKKSPVGVIVSVIIFIAGIIILVHSQINTFDYAKKYDQYKGNKKTTTTQTTTSTITLKNYQQIYNEYSQKLINAGPTSSINEMATILDEGVTKMAQYMYSAKGTDGQYATYQSWADKLCDVYINNCK